MGKAEMTSTK